MHSAQSGTSGMHCPHVGRFATNDQVDSQVDAQQTDWTGQRGARMLRLEETRATRATITITTTTSILQKLPTRMPPNNSLYVAKKQLLLLLILLLLLTSHCQQPLATAAAAAETGNNGRNRNNNNNNNADPLNAARPQQHEHEHEQQQQPLGSPQIDINYLAKSRGFAIESHKVITKDQYILVAHRLINPRWPTNGQAARGLVILQHGILCASPLFLMNSSPFDRPSGRPIVGQQQQQQQQQRRQRKPRFAAAAANSSATTSFYELLNLNSDSDSELGRSNSLAIALSNQGYDVWLTNFRGTQYSHEHLREHGPDYWKFNVDNLIEYDLGAYVSYILKLTKRKQYTYIGHSLGATVGLGSLLVHSQTPVINRLSCSILMAPVASTQFMRGSLIPLFKLATLFYGDPAPFPGQTATLASFIRSLCLLVPRLCSWLANMVIGDKQVGERAGSSPLLSLVPGFSPLLSSLSRRRESPMMMMMNSGGGNNNTSRHYSGHSQTTMDQEDALFLMMHQSISIQLLKHIVQVHSTGKLSRFSYGAQGNKLVYGKQAAPTYDLTQINEPHLRVALVSGLSDAISTPDEVNWIAGQIGSKVGHLEQITIPANPFNHMDLVMSKDAYRLVNRRVIEFIERNGCFS